MANFPPQQLADEAGLEEERAEREERRGLEARAGALLAAGAAVIGLLATGLSGVNVRGWEREVVLGLFGLGTAVMLYALMGVARALNLGMIRREKGEERHNYADRIRTNNEKMVNILGPATLVFASSVAFFLAALLWAAWASSPSSSATVKVVVKSERGRTGARGPRGTTGPRGPAGDRGPVGPPEPSPGGLGGS
jgi:hypothetical protein